MTNLIKSAQREERNAMIGVVVSGIVVIAAIVYLIFS